MRRTLVAILGVTLAACGGSRSISSSSPDGGTSDPSQDGGFDAGVFPPWPARDGGSCSPPSTPSLLSQECLYSDLSTRTLRPDVVEYAPAYGLWSDGAAKRRFILLPPGAQIDSNDMDHWQFPVGTTVFKEFALDGGALETRMIRRNSLASTDYTMVSFIWKADGSDAVATSAGQSNVLGTEHDVPSSTQCRGCHDGEPGRVLGFSAVQLSKADDGVSLKMLATNGLLTAPPPRGEDYPAPGNSVQAEALGYLHANCGHCHNPNGEAWQFVKQDLRLRISERDPAQTQTALTTINKKTQAIFGTQATYRVVPKDPAQSDVYLRMNKRDTGWFPPNMPPLGTEHVDPEGTAAVKAWIDGL